MSLYDRLGEERATALAQETTPFPYRIFSRLTRPLFIDALRDSDSLAHFEQEHCRRKREDWLYFYFRPRGREAIKIMRERYGFD